LKGHLQGILKRELHRFLALGDVSSQKKNPGQQEHLFVFSEHLL
jgi:hypothetical protein